MMTPGEFAEAVSRYAMLTGASATSWGRSVEHNRTVGGVAHSAHIVWLGCDLVYDTTPSPDRVEWARRLGLKIVVESDHDHVQPLGWEAG